MSSVRYEIERVLGRGGMATVYLARDCELDRPVALKVLTEHLAGDDSYRARFLREARAAARLVHPNVVQVFDVSEDERGLFIVMEYVDGVTLAEELARRGSLPPDEAVDIAVQICAGLEQAHAAGLVHRDVKPRNILLRDGVAKLADFGIARTLDGTGFTEQGVVLGTAAYLAPEQARGEPVTAAADLYSLGVVLYELLTGRRPFEAETLPALLLQREQGVVVRLRDIAPQVPQALEDAVSCCLAQSPERRPESAAALAHLLADSGIDVPTQPLPEPTGVRATEVLAATAATKPLRRVRSNWGRPAARPRRRRAVGLAAALVLAAALTVGLVLANDGSDGTAEAGRNPPPAEAAPPPAEPAPPPPQTTAEQAAQGDAPATDDTAPATPAAEPVSACAGLEQRKSELEERKQAIEEQKRQTKDKAERKALDEQKRALDEEKREIDRQLKECR
jgi:serine/threonine-protein kinase